MVENESPFEEIKLSNRIEQIINQQSRIAEAINPVIKLQERMAENLKPVIGLQEQMEKAVTPIIELGERMNEAMKPIVAMNIRIKERLDPLINIDWKGLSEAAAERVKYTDQQLKEYEDLLWCLDIETLAVLEEKQMKIGDLPKHVKESLEEYMEEILGDPMFSLHSSLIEETYAVYNSGHYKLCIFPLFAVFEHIINSWIDGNIQGESILITKRPQGRRYYTKINKLVDYDKDSELKVYIKVYALSVLRVYLKTFETFGDEPNKELNRHSVAHGFHDYDSITETDVLKLFQLIKATMILPYISVEEINMQ